MSAERFFRRFISTATAGLFLLLPVTVIFFIILKIWQIFFRPVQNIAKQAGMDYPFVANLILIVLLLLICFLGGLMMRANRVSHFRDFLEGSFLKLIPGYEFVKLRLMESFGEDELKDNRSILARIDDGWSPGMLIDRAEDGRCVVFIPNVPRVSAGMIYIVEPERVIQLHVRYKELNNCIRNYGKGLLTLENGASKVQVK